MSASLSWSRNETGPDHRIARDEVGKFLLGHVISAFGALRDNQVADFSGRIPDAELDVVVQVEPELSQNRARFPDDVAFRRSMPPVFQIQRAAHPIAESQWGSDRPIADERHGLPGTVYPTPHTS